MLNLAIMLLWNQGGQVEFSDEFLEEFNNRGNIEVSYDHLRRVTKVSLVGIPFKPPTHEGPVRAESERLDRPRSLGPGRGEL